MDARTKEIARFYNELYGTEPSKRFERALHPIYNFLPSVEHPSATVIEFGAGVGVTAVHLAKLGYDVTAVDISEEGFAQLKERARREGVRVRALAKDMRDFTFAVRYDVAIAELVLHHLTPRTATQFLQRMKQAVKVGGCVVLNVHLDTSGFATMKGARGFYPNEEQVRGLFTYSWSIQHIVFESSPSWKKDERGQPYINNKMRIVAIKNR